jgi:hypothetical protein
LCASQPKDQFEPNHKHPGKRQGGTASTSNFFEKGKYKKDNIEELVKLS